MHGALGSHLADFFLKPGSALEEVQQAKAYMSICGLLMMCNIQFQYFMPIVGACHLPLYDQNDQNKTLLIVWEK